MKIERYSFIGRIKSAIITFKEKRWIDGYEFSMLVGKKVMNDD